MSYGVTGRKLTPRAGTADCNVFVLCIFYFEVKLSVATHMFFISSDLLQKSSKSCQVFSKAGGYNSPIHSTSLEMSEVSLETAILLISVPH